MTRLTWLSLAAASVAALGFTYWKLAIPAYRAEIRSELIMLGDLDHDRRWTQSDLHRLDAFLNDPFAAPASTAALLDLNQNARIDPEDLAILHALAAAQGDPYSAEAQAREANRPFPRPRELYRYLATTEYRPRPLLALPYLPAQDSVLPFLKDLHPDPNATPYAQALEAAIFEEAVRFDRTWRRRAPALLPIERDYAHRKLARATALHQAGQRHELLLALIELTEDAETLTTRGQPDFNIRLLAFRDHLRDVLASPLYTDFRAGRQSHHAVLEAVSAHLQSDLGLSLDLETLEKPRDLANLENYLQRAEWQYYKSAASERDFRALVAFAQHDRRYLHAVARTSPKHADPNVENHNLPMVLLFREALRIQSNDKKRAVGLLDEAIRIPYAWIRSIPREALPPALAPDNFLLPGNKEDGADKSRHWNVFGGVCLYKSPREALNLALQREVQDLREANFSEPAMREFLRDMIANLNGMFHVAAVQPALLASQSR